MDSIEHGRAVQYYKDILAGKPPSSVGAKRPRPRSVSGVGDVSLEPDDGLALHGVYHHDSDVHQSDRRGHLAAGQSSGSDSAGEKGSTDESFGVGDETDALLGGPTEAATAIASLQDAHAQAEVHPEDLLSGLPSLTADPVPASQHDAQSSLQRLVSEQTISSWGPAGFRLTFRQPSTTAPSGAWQATCRYHRHTATARCTKTVVLSNAREDEKLRCLRLCMHWCVQADRFQLASQHSGWNPRHFPLPHQSVIDAQAQRMVPPHSQAVPDQELTQSSAAAAAQAVAPKRGVKSRKTTLPSEQLHNDAGHHLEGLPSMDAAAALQPEQKSPQVFPKPNSPPKPCPPKKRAAGKPFSVSAGRGPEEAPAGPVATGAVTASVGTTIESKRVQVKGPSAAKASSSAPSSATPKPEPKDKVRVAAATAHASLLEAMDMPLAALAVPPAPKNRGKARGKVAAKVGGRSRSAPRAPPLNKGPSLVSAQPAKASAGGKAAASSVARQAQPRAQLAKAKAAVLLEPKAKAQAQAKGAANHPLSRSSTSSSSSTDSSSSSSTSSS